MFGYVANNWKLWKSSTNHFRFSFWFWSNLLCSLPVRLSYWVNPTILINFFFSFVHSMTHYVHGSAWTVRFYSPFEKHKVMYPLLATTGLIMFHYCIRTPRNNEKEKGRDFSYENEVTLIKTQDGRVWYVKQVRYISRNGICCLCWRGIQLLTRRKETLCLLAQLAPLLRKCRTTWKG